MSNIFDPGQRKTLHDRFLRLRADSPAQWGRMNAHGMVCHLTDSFLACLGERPVSMKSTLAGRTVMRFFALSTPMPWPKGVPTMPEVDQEKAGSAPYDFEADVARLLKVMDRFVAELDVSAIRHPLFGRLTAGEWGRWAYRHMHHHGRQFGV